MSKTLSILFLAAFVLLAGCNQQPSTVVLPEVNDQNCRLEINQQIKNKAARQEFAGQCSRRSIGIAPTVKPKNWLDLTDKN
ncbi:entry exclusion lipoprotein TrbK [Pusillimonas sp. MFBS29]|uniref:entry exclusion lipoprotein TrbK n=1 Tax=Pusillimonas sp. MFBS29 TaxID=2886690 RepID=UPI001D0FC11A|nr:entry exclusion lipoprotein TrbK [Pusillimonas sp. MFBS29]MCC2594736.1 entry exclusion lipoprotein TrbK [Pusillimonas sp. MFBS29]